VTQGPFAERQIHAAEEESLCREENERVEEPRLASDHTEYTCECTRDCDALLSLTADEYEAVREVPTHFLVAPGHLVVGVEVIVRETSRFQVVEKFGAAAPVATALDPRSHP
jgi:hypothetical protein